MSSQLPFLPNIDHLRYQAKYLFELCRVGDNTAVEQLCQVFHEFRVLNIIEIAASVRLHHAQDVVARCYGYQRWAHLCESVDIARRATLALSTSMEDPKMEDLDYRAGIARSKGLPEIGTSRVSEHGVRYEVVDYAPAVSAIGAARVRSGGPMAHIGDLLPIISFPEMSDRLYELYIETDTVTSRQILFFDTLPEMHPNVAMIGMHQVITPAQGNKLFVHFDASRVHETFIAHELGHIWVERVEQKEDYRQPKDQSDLPKATQFYHVQSFVMDLCVNDMLMRRGFDMSVIASDQAQTIVNFAENVAKKTPMKGKRVLAAVINTLAGAMLEMERFPNRWDVRIRTALEMIEMGLPEAFEPAKGFVESVLRHGYTDSAAIMRVVDECAAISFAATGDSFDAERDLELIEHSEPQWDKRPEFLSCLPQSCKSEVFRLAAKHGVTGRANYNVLIHGREDASVMLTDPLNELAEPIRLYFNLPYRPDPRLMPGAPMPNLPIGSAYIPHLGMPNSGAISLPTSRPDPFGLAGNLPSGLSNNQHNGFQSPAPYDPYQGLPESVRAMMNPNSTADSRNNGWNQPNDINRFGSDFRVGPHAGAPAMVPFAEQAARIKRLNEEHERHRAEEQYRIRMQNQRLMETHCESYSGTDLKPMLTGPGEEHARLQPRRQIAAPHDARNYMAGVGLWISRVGFEQQMDGESAYGYCMNNPVSHTDPSGLQPDKSAGKLVPCPPEVRRAKNQLCDNLIGLGHDGIVNSSCCTGPRQAQCLLDWCNNNSNAYCIDDTTGDCNNPKNPVPNPCANDYSRAGMQDSRGAVYLCWPRVLGPSCAWTKQPGATCKSELVDRILHEMMHLCGSSQGGGSGISDDPAENRAQCLCGKMKL